MGRNPETCDKVSVIDASLVCRKMCLFINKIKTDCCERTSVGLILPDACSRSLDPGKLVTSSLYTDWELAKMLPTTAKYSQERRRAFSVWTTLQRKPDTVESATANEDNLSRFMSKLHFFLFFFHESFNFRLGCSTSVCSLMRYNAHLQSFDNKRGKKKSCVLKKATGKLLKQPLCWLM